LKDIAKKLGYNQLKKRLFSEFNKSVLEPFIFTGKITLQESRFLGELVVKANNYKGPIIEIGTLFGHSTQVICLFKEANKEFLTIDKFRWNPIGFNSEMQYDLTMKILSEAIKNHNLSLINMDKDDFYKQYKGDAPALVFFDADHSYEATLKDLLWAREVQAKIICGHDYAPHIPGVVKAVNEVAGGEPQEVRGSLFLM
jgi:hypothetical protein